MLEVFICCCLSDTYHLNTKNFHRTRGRLQGVVLLMDLFKWVMFFLIHVEVILPIIGCGLHTIEIESCNGNAPLNNF